MTMVHVVKYEFYTFKITIGCRYEKLNPIGIKKLEMVYRKRSADLTPIIHTFNDISDEPS